jgi:hypothetical protein
VPKPDTLEELELTSHAYAEEIFLNEFLDQQKNLRLHKTSCLANIELSSVRAYWKVYA